MNYKLLGSVAAAAAALVLASPLYAAGDKAGPQAGPNRFLERFDTNKDGKVSKEEFDAKANGRFDNMDTNGDKTVTLKEFEAYVEKMRQERLQRGFDRLDKDKSGGISEAEFVGRDDNIFSRLDKNNDGVIEQSEMPQRPFHHRGPGGDGPPPDETK